MALAPSPRLVTLVSGSIHINQHTFPSLPSQYMSHMQSSQAPTLSMVRMVSPSSRSLADLPRLAPLFLQLAPLLNPYRPLDSLQL